MSEQHVREIVETSNLSEYPTGSHGRGSSGCHRLEAAYLENVKAV